MEDYPYSVIKQRERSYKIMLLHDQCNKTFFDISEEYGISVTGVKQTYHQIKRKQMYLYVNHISIVLGHEDTLEVRKVFDDANEWYQDLAYANAYLERKYQSILIKYRAGEPGMTIEFIRNMPPLQPELSEETIDYVVKMKEIKDMSYAEIAKRLCMTPSKVRYTYEKFYHKKVLALIQKLTERIKSSEEKRAVLEYYFDTYTTSKKRYDALVKKISLSDGD